MNKKELSLIFDIMSNKYNPLEIYQERNIVNIEKNPKVYELISCFITFLKRAGFQIKTLRAPKHSEIQYLTLEEVEKEGIENVELFKNKRSENKIREKYEDEYGSYGNYISRYLLELLVLFLKDAEESNNELLKDDLFKNLNLNMLCLYIDGVFLFTLSLLNKKIVYIKRYDKLNIKDKVVEFKKNKLKNDLKIGK